MSCSKRTRWVLLILVGLVLLGLGWLAFSNNAEITALRNIIHYQVVKRMGGPQIRDDLPPGAITGTILDKDGAPLTGAIALVSSPIGHTYAAEADIQGAYHIDSLPPGRYVPIAGKRGYEDAFSQRCTGSLCFKRTVTVRPATESRGVDFALSPESAPIIALDNSLVVSPTMEIEVGAPFPSRSLRTRFSFQRDELWVNDCYLYEPLEGEGPFPTMLLVLPGPVKGWEIIPVPFAAEGFSVLACYPLRGIDIDEDATDLLTALEYLKQGQIPSRADTERLALVSASFTSLHTYRLLGVTDLMDVTLVLGGMSDGFAFRHDVETEVVHTRPPFDQLLTALGFPNISPELYFKYSALYHLEGLPPACLLHGWDDELVPFNQSVLLSAEMTRRGMPHESYTYDGLKHYFSTSADNETTQQMFQDSLDCMRRWLEGD